MATPQAFISFTGITGIEGGSFAMERGVAPGTGEIVCVPQNISTNVGTLEIRYVYDVATHLPPDFVLSAPMSVIKRVTLEGGGQATKLKLQICDFREWWQYSHVDGNYNEPLGNGGYTNVMTLRDLMSLCLEQLQPMPAGYDISAVDPTPRPRVEWKGDRADSALAELMADYGYELVVRLSGVCAVVPIGEGEPLPTFGAEKTTSYSAPGGSLPQSLRIACADVVYETQFILEPVGEDTDGSIKHINSLSYRPANGWVSDDFEFEDVAGDYNVNGQPVPKAELAKKTVYKWYRASRVSHSLDNNAPPGFLAIDESGNVGPASPDQQGDVDLHHLLPLIPKLNRTVSGDESELKPAVVSGVYYDEAGLDDNTKSGTPYERGFSVDGATGIVKFSQQVYKSIQAGSDASGPIYGIGPAELRLLCTCSVTDTNSRSKQYYAATFPAGGPVGVRTVEHAEIVPRVTAEFNGDAIASTAHNLANVNTQAAFYAAAETARMAPQSGVVIEYQGIRAIELDGLRRQVEWRVGFGQASSTRASYGTEISAFDQTYEQYIEGQRRRAEQIRSRRARRELLRGIEKQAGSVVQ